ncbi:hypothetical protein [Nitrobacter sp. 62-13]|jgi:hypothetical protein|uniref:hypothetical protein n=1 Tax=Nitrobacter sp. 62-13 TaxID=1895797 RepID=UPI0026009EB5|nr:hypothetical protein [Nitrobacter sp. 62-13]
MDSGPAPSGASRNDGGASMIPKSGNRFSEKIMLKQKISDDPDSVETDSRDFFAFNKDKQKTRHRCRGFCVS